MVQVWKNPHIHRKKKSLLTIFVSFRFYTSIKSTAKVSARKIRKSFFLMSVYFSFRQWRFSVRSAVSQLPRGHRKLRPLFWEPARGSSLLLFKSMNTTKHASEWTESELWRFSSHVGSKIHNTFCIMIESMMYGSPARPIYAVGDSKNTGLPMRPLQQVRSFGLWWCLPQSLLQRQHKACISWQLHACINSQQYTCR